MATPAFLSTVSAAPAATISEISAYESVPAEAVQRPGLPPAEKGQPAVLHPVLERVKLLP